MQSSDQQMVQRTSLPSHHERYDTDHPIFSHPLDALRYLLVNGVLEASLQTVAWNADAPGPLELLQRQGQRSRMRDW
jgi:hypothetical protein